MKLLKSYLSPPTISLCFFFSSIHSRNLIGYFTDSNTALVSGQKRCVEYPVAGWVRSILHVKWLTQLTEQMSRFKIMKLLKTTCMLFLFKCFTIQWRNETDLVKRGHVMQRYFGNREVVLTNAFLTTASLQFIFWGDEGLWSHFPSILLFFVIKYFDATKMFRLQHLYETLVFSRRETSSW